MEKELFEIEYNKEKLVVEIMNLPGQVLFKIIFPNNTPALIICRATDINGTKFWTSIPEGRQQEAVGIGRFIEQYFKAKLK